MKCKAPADYEECAAACPPELKALIQKIINKAFKYGRYYEVTSGACYYKERDTLHYLIGKQLLDVKEKK